MSIYVEQRAFYRGVKLYLSRPHGDGRVSIAEPVVMRTMDASVQESTEPMLSLSPEQAQELVDGLWQCGYRPTEGSGSAGSLKATERHLADMRELAMGALKKSGAL